MSTVVNEILFLKQAREFGFILVPENIFYSMVKLAYREKSEASKIWRDAGVWIGKLFKARFGDEALSQFKNLAPRLFWDIPELEISILGRELEIVATSPKFTQEYSELFKSMLEGLLNAFSYDIIVSEIIGKTVRLKGRMRNV
ncbi:hypothetical protein ACSU1N_01720 [Thermogladius sp. 4427co]|uniref:hypothetical protein n=1 Tax=Thermogladius sp. 4427co TaxID=3450718 RepID=UPI003F7AC771